MHIKKRAQCDVIFHRTSTFNYFYEHSLTDGFHQGWIMCTLDFNTTMSVVHITEKNICGILVSSVDIFFMGAIWVCVFVYVCCDSCGYLKISMEILHSLWRGVFANNSMLNFEHISCWTVKRAHQMVLRVTHSYLVNKSEKYLHMYTIDAKIG